MRAWKRPALLVASAAIATLFLVLAWFAAPDQDAGEHVAVVIGTSVGLAGLVIGAFACDRCVAKVFGGV